MALLAVEASCTGGAVPAMPHESCSSIACVRCGTAQYGFMLVRLLEYGLSIDSADLIEVEVSEATVPLLLQRGVEVIRINGLGNRILMRDGGYAGPRIDFAGSGSCLVLDGCTMWRGTLTAGSEATAVIGGGQHSLDLNATVYSDSLLWWGRNSNTFGCRVWAHGGKAAIIEDGCLFSEGISIRTSDHHSIIDLDEFQQLNRAQDVRVGERTWLGPGCTLLPGTSTGKGSILGAGSVLTSNVPSFELWAGVPARKLRGNVSWVQPFPATDIAVAELRTWMNAHQIRSRST